jgi:hypothetical protein
MIRQVSSAPSCREKRVLSPTSAAWSSTSCSRLLAACLPELHVELGKQRLRLARGERREGESATTVIRDSLCGGERVAQHRLPLQFIGVSHGVMLAQFDDPVESKGVIRALVHLSDGGRDSLTAITTCFGFFLPQQRVCTRGRPAVNGEAGPGPEQNAENA